MAYGNEAGIVIIDIEQKVCLLNVGSPDLYGAQDPYSRVPRSPKKNTSDILPLMTDKEERQPRSPSIDQVSVVLVMFSTYYYYIQLSLISLSVYRRHGSIYNWLSIFS